MKGTALMENESRISNSSKSGSGGNFSPQSKALAAVAWIFSINYK